MGEIKSAWEIAQEKVEKLGKLSPDELKKKSEEKFTLIGQAIADKYLGGLDLWQLEVELDKYKSEEKATLKESVALKLVQAIELGNNERLSRIIEGIAYLKQEKAVREIDDKIKKLFKEYNQVEQEGSEKLEKSAGEILHQLRISGSAIASVNPKALGEGKQDLEQLTQPYRERLEPLKQKLIDLPLE